MENTRQGKREDKGEAGRRRGGQRRNGRSDAAVGRKLEETMEHTEGNLRKPEQDLRELEKLVGDEDPAAVFYFSHDLKAS